MTSIIFIEQYFVHDYCNKYPTPPISNKNWSITQIVSLESHEYNMVNVLQNSESTLLYSLRLIYGLHG